jgi:hypothetical protein
MTADVFPWDQFGLAVIAGCLIVFVLAALKRRWTIWAMLAGLANLPFAFMNAAAPFRGALDPEYVGYGMGMVRAAPGAEVAAFAGFMLVGGLVSALIAVLNQPGARNYLIVGFNSVVLLITTPSLLDSAANGFRGVRVEFGEYLQFAGFSAFAFEFALITLPVIYSLMWAWGRASKS